MECRFADTIGISPFQRNALTPHCTLYTEKFVFRGKRSPENELYLSRCYKEVRSSLIQSENLMRCPLLPNVPGDSRKTRSCALFWADQ